MRCSSAADRNVLIVSFGFFFVFSGYNATQRFATSVDAKNGSISLGILYIVSLITNFSAGPIFKTFSSKMALVLSTFAYIFFIASNIGYNLILLYLSAVFVGLSAPILWISKERLVTDSSNYYELSNDLPLYSKIGHYNGVFWIIFLFHTVLGSLFGAIVLQFGFSIDIMYAVFTLLTIIGAIILMFVQNIKNEDISTMTDDYQYKQSIDDGSDIEMVEDKQLKLFNNKNDDETQKLIMITNGSQNNKCYWIINEIKMSIYSIIKLWKEWNFQCIFIYTIYTALLVGYIGADYPLLMKDETLKLYMLAYYGFISAIFALIFGKLADKISFTPIVGVVFIVHSFYWIYLYLFMDEIMDKQSVLTLIGLSTALALGEAGCTQIYAMYPILLGKEHHVWQSLHIFRTLPISAVFFIHNFVTIEIKIITYAIIMVLGCIPILLFPSIRKQLKSVLHKKTIEQL